MKFSLLRSIQALFHLTNARRSWRRRDHGSVAAEMLEPRQLMTVYSIDPVNGSDSNPGTLELPYRTPIHLSYGTETLNHRTLQAGDVVYLRDGLHDWSSLLTNSQEYDYHAAFLIRGVHGTEFVVEGPGHQRLHLAMMKR